MTATFTLVKNDIGPQIARYSAEMKRSFPVVVKSTAKGITRRVIDLTPPASAGSTGRDARRTGESKIYRQMSSALAPVKLKGRRKITMVFGQLLKKPIYVPTKEKYPDVAGIYRANVRARGTGVGISVSGRGRKFYVDVRKFKAELVRRQAQVGTLAAGWMAAAQALDVPVQQWISRHGTGGGQIQPANGQIQPDQAGRLSIVVTNLGGSAPSNVRAELARRIPYAMQYQAAAMERAIVGYHERIRQKLGFRLY